MGHQDWTRLRRCTIDGVIRAEWLDIRALAPQEPAMGEGKMVEYMGPYYGGGGSVMGPSQIPSLRSPPCKVGCGREGGSEEPTGRELLHGLDPKSERFPVPLH